MLDDQAVEDRTNVVIKMAHATGDSAEEVSSYMTAIWNNFDDGSKSLEHYADVITALGASTASSSSEIASGLQQFAAIAETTGLSYDYATSALATLVANTRQSADTIGNSLKTIFSRLQGLSLGETLEDGVNLNKYSNALRKIGVDVIDVNGNLVEANTILDETAEKWKNLTNEQKMAFAQTVAGTRQYSVLMSLMDNWDDMETNLQTASGADGTLENQARIYAESWEASKNRVKAAVQEIYQSLIDDKFFIKVNNIFSSFLNLINDTIKGLGGLKGTLVTIGTIISQVFSKQIISGMNDTFYNLRSLITGNEKLVELKSEANKLLVTNSIDQDTTLGKISSEAYKMQGQAQLDYIDNAKRMSQEEQKISQILLDRQDVMAQSVIKSGEELAAQEELISALERQISLEKTRSNANVEARLKNLGNMARNYGNMQQVDNVLWSQNDTIDQLINNTGTAEQASQILNMLSQIEEGYEKIGITAEEALGEDAYEAFEKMKKALSGATVDTNLLQEGWVKWGEIMKNTDPSRQVNLINGLSQELGISRERINEFINANRQAGQVEGETAQKTQELSAELLNFQKFLTNVKGELTTLGGNLLNFSQIISSFGNIGNTITGLVDKWSDSESNLSSKITSTATSLGIMIPIILRAAKAVKKMSTSGSALGSVLGPIAIAIGVAITAFTLYQHHLEEIQQKHKDLAEEAKKNSDELVESANANQELITSYENALQAYKETGEGKENLNDITQQLLDSYDLESERLHLLRGDYESVTKAIKDKEQAELENTKSSLKTSLETTGTVFTDEMRKGNSNYYQHRQSATGEYIYSYIAKFGNGALYDQYGNGDDEEAIGKAYDKLFQAGKLQYIHKDAGGDLTLESDQDYESIMASYTEVLALVEEIKEQAKELYGEDKYLSYLNNNSELWKNLQSWLKQGQDSYDSLVELQDQYKETNIGLAIKEALSSVDLDNITNLDEFNKIVDKAIEKLVNSDVGMSEDDARNAILSSLAISNETLSSWANFAENIDAVKEKTGLTEEEIRNFYDKHVTNDRDKELFWTINFDLVKSEENLEKAWANLQEVSKEQEYKGNIDNLVAAKEAIGKGDKEGFLSFLEATDINWGETIDLNGAEYATKSLEELLVAGADGVNEELDKMIAAATDQWEGQVEAAHLAVAKEMTENDLIIKSESSSMEEFLNKYFTNLDNSPLKQEILSMINELDSSSEDYAEKLSAVMEKVGIAITQDEIEAYVAANNDIKLRQKEQDELNNLLEEYEASKESGEDFASIIENYFAAEEEEEKIKTLRSNLQGLKEDLKDLTSGSIISEDKFKIFEEAFGSDLAKNFFTDLENGSYQLNKNLEGSVALFKAMLDLKEEESGDYLYSDDAALSMVTSFEELDVLIESRGRQTITSLLGYEIKVEELTKNLQTTWASLGKTLLSNKAGSSISAEQFEILNKQAPELTKNFKENADGSYTLTKAFEDLTPIMKILKEQFGFAEDQMASLCTSIEQLQTLLDTGLISQETFTAWEETLKTTTEETTYAINEQYDALSKLQSAIGSLSLDSSAEDLMKFKEDSGITWGENGILSFSTFVSMMQLDYDKAMSYIQGISETAFQATYNEMEKQAEAANQRVDEAKAKLEELQSQGYDSDNSETYKQAKDDYDTALTEKQTAQDNFAAINYERQSNYLSNLDSDLDASVIKDLTNSYLDMNDALDDGVVTWKEWEAAADAAVRDSRINDAIDDLKDNWESYNEILEEVQDADDEAAASLIALSDDAKPLRESLADLLDTNEEFISANFLQNIDPQTLYDAANGSEEAIERIRNAFIDAQSAEWGVTEGLEEFKQAMNELPDGQVLTLDEQPFIEALISAQLQAGASAQNIENTLSGFGIDCDITPITTSLEAAREEAALTGEEIVGNLSYDVETTSDSQEEKGLEQDVAFNTRFEDASLDLGDATVLEAPYPFGGQAQTIPIVYKGASKIIEPDIQTEETKKSTPLTGVKVSNMHKSSGGNIRKSNTNAAKAPTSSKSSSPKSSSPRSTSTRAKDRSNKSKLTAHDVKGDKKNIETEIERYHQINNTLDDINDNISKYSKTAERAFGKSSIEALKKTTKEYKELAKATKIKLEENKQYERQDKAVAQSYGFTFGNDGNVDNYKEHMEYLGNQYNDAVEQYRKEVNAARDWWNGLTGDQQAQDSNKKHYDTLEQAAKDKLDDAKEYYQKATESLKTYEDTMELQEDLIEQQTEAMRQALDTELKTIDTTIELKLDINDRDIKYLEELIDQLGDFPDTYGENIGLLSQQIKDYVDDSSSAAKGLKAILKLYTSSDYSDNPLTNDEVKRILNGNIDEELSKKLPTVGFTDDTIKQMEDYQNQQYKSSQALRELRDKALTKVKEAFDEYTKSIEKNSEKLEHLLSVNNSYKNILGIIGKKVLDANGELTKGLDKANFELQRNNTHALKSELDFIDTSISNMKKEIAELERTNADEYTIKKLKSQLQEMEETRDNTYENWLSSWEAECEAVATIYSDTLTQIVDDFSDSLAGALGSLDALAEEFSRKTQIADIYVEDYEKIYNLTKLTRDIERSIDDSDNIRSKKALKSLLQEVQKLQEDGSKLSEYDLENLRRQYELELAMQQLKEAQESKSQVRMSRDSEGNYGYVYTADQNAVADAEDNYANKLYEMQKANAEYINELQNNIISAQQACASAIANLDASQFASHEEYEAEIAKIQEDYNQLMAGYYQQLDDVLVKNKRLYENEWTAYNEMTGYKISADEDYVDSFGETTYALLTKFPSIIDAEQNWQKSVSDACNDAKQNYSEWYSAMNTALSDGQSSIETFASDTTNTAKELQDLGKELEKSAENLVKTYTNAYDDILDAFDSFVDKYSESADKTISKNTALVNSINAFIKAASGVKSDEEIAASSSSSSSNNDVIVEDVDNDVITSRDVAIINQLTANQTVQDLTKAEEAKDKAARNARRRRRRSRTSSRSGSGSNNSNKVAGVAAAIWMLSNYGGWGTGSERAQKLSSKGVSGAQDYINQHARNGDIYRDWNNRRNELQNYKYGAFDTGGYTGNWGSSEGRLALLHQKEIVLNANDTENFLKAVDIIRQISQTIDLNALSASNNLASILQSPSNYDSNNTQTLEQQVQITATFEGATDRNEIEAAFDNLINRAAQFANRKK